MWLKVDAAIERYGGRSRQYLDKLHRTKGLLRRKNGKTPEYDSDSYDQFIGYNAGSCKAPQKIGKPSVPKEPIQKDQSPKRKTGGNQKKASSQITGATLAEVEIELKQEKVIGERFKNKTNEQNSIDRTQTEDLFFEIARNVRDALEAIPTRAATICEGKTRHEIEQILTEEIKTVLTNLVLSI